MRLKRVFILVICNFIFIGHVYAADQPATDKVSKTEPMAGKTNIKEKVIDFETDVIEGEKKRPDLFLNLKNEEINLENVLYMRSNFDDYYSVSKPVHFKFIIR